jgi:hypothetical protein
MDKVPWWVNAIYKVGVPTAIACYLVWFLTTKVQNNLEAIQSNVAQHTQDTMQNSRTNRQILHMLQTICINEAQNASERNECLK